MSVVNRSIGTDDPCPVQALEKVTATDLFYLRSMDEGMAVNVPYLLAQYLFRYAEGRKHGAKMFGGHFIARLTEHFGLLIEERLQGMTVVVRDLTKIYMDELVRLRICERLLEIPTWVAPRPERQQCLRLTWRCCSPYTSPVVLSEQPSANWNCLLSHPLKRYECNYVGANIGGTIFAILLHE
ncbi:hypothetical protein Tco_0540135 [Tanacetum coccineum]